MRASPRSILPWITAAFVLVVVQFTWIHSSVVDETIQHYYGIAILKELTIPSIDKFCELHQHRHVWFHFNCTDLYVNSGGGTGNWLLAFYAMRLATRGRLTLECTDSGTSSLIPYVLGDFEPRPDNTEVCGKSMKDIPLHRMQDEIRRDLSALRDFDSGIDNFDEAVVHFRCGDLVVRGHPGYSFVRFPVYRRYLPPNTSRVGILTQPLWKEGNRRLDRKGVSRCRTLVSLLEGYLQRYYPNVAVHDEADLRVTYQRMLRAQTLIGSESTFAAFAALTSNETVWMPRPQNDRAPNQWMLRSRFDGWMDLDPVLDTLPSERLTEWWNESEKSVLEWFVGL